MAQIHGTKTSHAKGAYVGACLIALGVAASCTACDAVMSAKGAFDATTGTCPDMNSIEAIEKFDFAKKFALPADAALRVKAAASAAAEIKKLDTKIDAAMLGACGEVAMILALLREVGPEVSPTVFAVSVFGVRVLAMTERATG